MNPEITHLVPVLNSYWLMIHVAVITASYGFYRDERIYWPVGPRFV